jgi:hypothetical protein
VGKGTKKKGEKMTNKEWLEKVKKGDEDNIKEAKGDMILFIDEMNTTNELNYRQAKALEIIADELIKLNERFVSITGSDDFIRVRLKGTN